MSSKIISRDKLGKLVETLKHQKLKLVLVGGCFDILHYGHVKFLEKAKMLGNKLMIALESDDNVKKIKGKNRPFHTQMQRGYILSALKVVDYVFLLPPMNQDEEYRDLIIRIAPEVIATTEGDLYLKNKREQAELISADIQVISKIETHSSSELAKLLGLD